MINNYILYKETVMLLWTSIWATQGNKDTVIYERKRKPETT